MYDSEMYACTVSSPFLSFYGNDLIEKEIIDSYKNKVRSIIVEPYQIPYLKEMEKKYGNGYTRTAMTIGYPYGGLTIRTKVELVRYAVEHEVTEVDVGIDITSMLSGEYEKTRTDLKAMIDAAEGKTLIVPVSWAIKVPLEMLDRLCNMYIELGLTAMKTSPGLHHGSMKVEHIEYIYRHFGDKLEIEVSGRVRTRAMAEKMKAAGATCFHISSWRRMCAGELDIQWDYINKTGGFTPYIDRTEEQVD